MADIVHHFPIKASADQVFQAISTPTGLDTWWTSRASGEPKEGAKYELSFGRWRLARCSLSLRYLRRIYGIRKYLTEARGIEPNRVVITDGGYSERLSTELWLIREGPASTRIPNRSRF